MLPALGSFLLIFLDYQKLCITIPSKQQIYFQNASGEKKSTYFVSSV